MNRLDHGRIRAQGVTNDVLREYSAFTNASGDNR
jgi:hypothetical protein